jgi:hypothetical protein
LNLLPQEVLNVFGQSNGGGLLHNRKASDGRLVRPTLRGALLGLEIGTSQSTLPVGAGRSGRTPHIALSGAFLALRASDCNGWPRRWVSAGTAAGLGPRKRAKRKITTATMTPLPAVPNHPNFGFRCRRPGATVGQTI